MYLLFNETDQVYASPKMFKSEADAQVFAVSFRESFAAQGYYRTVRGERIAPSKIVLRVEPAGNPWRAEPSIDSELHGYYRVRNHNRCIASGLLPDDARDIAEALNVLEEARAEDPEAD